MTKPKLDQGVDYERGFVDGMQYQMQSMSQSQQDQLNIK